MEGERERDYQLGLKVHKERLEGQERTGDRTGLGVGRSVDQATFIKKKSLY